MGLFGKKYKGASFTSEAGTVSNFSEGKLKKAYEALADEKISYISFKYSSGGGADSLKITRDKNGLFQADVKFYDKEGKKKLLTQDGLSADDTAEAVDMIVGGGDYSCTETWKSHEKTFDPKAAHDIARMISGSEMFASELDACFNSPADYYKEHASQYELRRVDQTSKVINICWVGLADKLLSAGLAAEFAFDADLDEFMYFMKKMAARQKLPFDEKLFDKRENVAGWCARLDEAWRGAGKCVAALDLKNHSYVTFIVSREDLKELSALADSIGRKISAPRDLLDD